MTELSENDQLREIGGLPPSVNTYHYNGMDDFNQILSFEDSRSFHPGVVIFIIEARGFERDFNERSSKLIFRVRLSFDDEAKILAVKMLDPVHEQAIRGFDTTIGFLLDRMGLRRNIFFWGSTRLKDGFGSNKEPTAGWGARRFPKRPHVVLEVAWSEGRAQLRRDLQYWVDPDRGNAEMAIGIEINQRQAEIIISQWCWTDQAKEQKNLEITKNGDKIKFEPNTAEPLLEIPLQALLIPRDTNITLDKEELIGLASGIWEMAGIQSQTPDLYYLGTLQFSD